jgi:serine/threonine protein kinase
VLVARNTLVAEFQRFCCLQAWFIDRTTFRPHSLRVAELEDFDTSGSGCRLLAHGACGAVSAVRPNAKALAKRGLVCVDERPVAIKALFNYDDSARVQKLMFDTEYLVALQCPHWSIVNVYNYFRGEALPQLMFASESEFDRTILSNQTTYMTMELCDGSLKQWMSRKCETAKSKRSLDPTKGARVPLLIALQLLIGLEHLDKHQIRHLDLKPDNVFVIKCRGGRESSCPQVVIGDFGTAHFGNQIKPEQLSGTACMRGPELWSKQAVYNLVGVDMWALGCMMFEMLEGYNPVYDPARPEDMERCIISGPAISLSDAWLAGHSSSHDRRMRSALHQVVAQMLERHVDKRITPRHAIDLIEGALWDMPYQVTLTWLSHQENVLHDAIVAQSGSFDKGAQMDIEQMLLANTLMRLRGKSFSKPTAPPLSLSSLTTGAPDQGSCIVN